MIRSAVEIDWRLCFHVNDDIYFTRPYKPYSFILTKSAGDFFGHLIFITIQFELLLVSQYPGCFIFTIWLATAVGN